MEALKFNDQEYEVKQVKFQDEELTYRAFENIIYVANPIDDIQKLNIYVPEEYYHNIKINNYDIETAPIFVPNSVGGYMPGPATQPGQPIFNKEDSVFRALQHGYVVVCIGIRGRKLENNVGVAPACIVDYKAGIRYLRHNKDNIPGDTEKIISNGTSAGGALSSLLGVTGNHPDYEPYLKELGAEDERDDIFAASCYCPITNLDHADMAYEWEFEGLNDYLMSRYLPDHKIEKIPGTMNTNQIQMSKELKTLFKVYFNDLHLQYENHDMNLDDLKEYIKKIVIQSADRALQEGNDLSSYDWIIIENKKVVDVDYNSYIQFRARMKPTPAFDNVEMGTPENELFGTLDTQYQHFTLYSTQHSLVNGKLADSHIIKMLNPMRYIDDQKAKTARHFRIRHGAIDRDTSLAISAILAIKLRNAGIEVDHFYPWNIAHSGDYDLDELFMWIDKICQ